MENNPKLTSILGYLSLVLWVLAYSLGDKEGAKFHLNQALVINIAGVFTFVPKIGWLIGIVVFVFWVMGLSYAIKQEEKKVPLIGEINLLS